MSGDAEPRVELLPVEQGGCADGCCAVKVTDADRRAVLSRRVRLLVAATIGYNVAEAVIAISAGSVASSTALIGFGLDSVIEVASASAVAWQFSGADPQARERTALKVIAASFFALAVYVTVESVRSLFGAEPAGHSTVGIVLAAVSLLVMPFLSRATPGRTRAGLGERGRRLEADAAVHLPLRRPAARAAGERVVRLVVGRSGRGVGDRRRRAAGRSRGVARRALLLKPR